MAESGKTCSIVLCGTLLPSCPLNIVLRQAATIQASYGSATSGLTFDQRQHYKCLISVKEPQSIVLLHAR